MIKERQTGSGDADEVGEKKEEERGGEGGCQRWKGARADDVWPH